MISEQQSWGGEGLCWLSEPELIWGGMDDRHPISIIPGQPPPGNSRPLGFGSSDLPSLEVDWHERAAVIPRAHFVSNRVF
jgi:hypothetical protein